MVRHLINVHRADLVRGVDELVLDVPGQVPQVEEAKVAVAEKEPEAARVVGGVRGHRPVFFGGGIFFRGARFRRDEAPRLYRIAQEVTHQAQMPMPNLYLRPQKSPTVFATGRDPTHAAVAVTEDIYRLDDAKLFSVLFRELSQIKSDDRLIAAIAASAAGAVSVLANIGK